MLSLVGQDESFNYISSTSYRSKLDEAMTTLTVVLITEGGAAEKQAGLPH
jgi:hypothetical protein